MRKRPDNNSIQDFFQAIVMGRLPALKALVDEYGDYIINARQPSFGRTALMIAVQNHQRGVIDFLVENGAMVDLKDNQGWTALMFATINGSAPMVRTLLEAGADMSMQEQTGRTVRDLLMPNWYPEVDALFASWPEIKKQRDAEKARLAAEAQYKKQADIAAAQLVKLKKKLPPGGLKPKK